MAKRKEQDETEELEAYLSDEFNLAVYEDLTEGDDAEVFEPLEFFKLLYSQYEFVRANKEKPLTVVKSLRKLKLTEEQLYVLLYWLCDLIKEKHESFAQIKDTQLKICLALMVKERDLIQDELISDGTEQQPVRASTFDFGGKVKPHLETLPDDVARLKYLYDIKAEYEQTIHPSHEWTRPTFAEQCSIEIRKIKARMELEKTPSAEIAVRSKGGREQRGRGGTQYQNLLAVHYLLLHARANSNNTEKAKFASFLTGYSGNTLRQQWSNIHRKAEESGQIWERDMRAVRGYFEALGLHEVTRLIDDDLNSEREKL